MKGLSLIVTALEASADDLGASLAASLRARIDGPLCLFGVGGAKLAGEGLESLFDPRDLAILGAMEAVAVWPRVRARARRIGELAAQVRPDAVVLIDAWGFSLRAAHAVRRSSPSTPIVKYVAPQVWATRPGRARTLASAVDALLALHDFDAPYFEREGLWTRCVANPVLSRPVAKADTESLRAELALPSEAPVLLILPGSRRAEVARLAPVFGATAARLKQEAPKLETILAVAEPVEAEVRDAVQAWRVTPRIVVGEARRWAAMRLATAALACSGTVTTELAMAGCPMVAAYRLDPPTYLAARALLRSRFVSLINVAAGRFVVPERLQGECRPDILAADLRRLLNDPRAREAQALAQSHAIARLGGRIADPAGAAADALLEVIARRRGDQPRVSSGA